MERLSLYIYFINRACTVAASEVEAAAGHDQQELWNPRLLPALARQNRGIKVGIRDMLKLYYKTLLNIFPSIFGIKNNRSQNFIDKSFIFF